MPIGRRAVTDAEVLRHASREKRVLITHDAHFGKLIFREGLPAPAGVLCVRPGRHGLTHVGPIIVALTDHPHIKVEGNYVTVEADRIRLRPLPPVEPEEIAPLPPVNLRRRRRRR